MPSVGIRSGRKAREFFFIRVSTSQETREELFSMSSLKNVPRDVFISSPCASRVFLRKIPPQSVHPCRHVSQSSTLWWPMQLIIPSPMLAYPPMRVISLYCSVGGREKKGARRHCQHSLASWKFDTQNKIMSIPR